MSRSSSASRSVRSAALALSLLAAGGCSQRAPATAACGNVAYQVSDPAEPANRAVFAFNRRVDDYLLAPVARGYSALPGFARQGMHNFASNFGEPKVFVNDLLQGNGERAMTSLSRFIFNTTLGVAGLVDVSGKMGLSQHRSDFGQTFGVWNIASGPIVELPLLGTHNLRDATGTVLGLALDPFGGNSDTVNIYYDGSELDFDKGTGEASEVIFGPSGGTLNKSIDFDNVEHLNFFNTDTGASGNYDVWL